MIRIQNEYIDNNGSFRIVDINTNPVQALVTVEMDNREWLRLRKKGLLGMLYGVDISNEVYRLDRRIYATHPTVAEKRAYRGIKKIVMYYPMHQSNGNVIVPKLKLLVGGSAND